MELLPDNKHQDEIVFYDKMSNFEQVHNLKCFDSGSNQYVLYIAQNESLANELAVASTDFSLGLLDLNTFQSVPFRRQDFHTDKIHSLKFQSDATQPIVFTASQDGSVKLWDRRNGESIASLKNNNRPFFSVDCNQTIICAGQNSEMVFWDIRKLKPALFTYQSSNTDDVTAVRYHKQNPNWLITSSTDNLLCHFDFVGKDLQNEEETMEGVYSSEQPLIDCGFIGSDKFWTLTSVNTVEVVNVENCDTFAKIEKFPHQVSYVIGCEQDRFTNQFAIYGGNNQGEIFLYSLADHKTLHLSDMILPSKASAQDQVIRQTLRVSQEQIVTTDESGNLSMYKYGGNGVSGDLNAEEEKESEIMGRKKPGNNNRQYKPY